MPKQRKKTDVSDNDLKIRRAVIVTALEVEYRAVRRHLSNLREESDSQGTIYERGTFISGSSRWDIGIIEVGAGSVSAAVEVNRTIELFQPDCVLFVGIAGGLKDVKLGDVVVATKIYGFEPGKASAIFQVRPNVANSPYRMEQHARARAKMKDWLRWLETPPDPLPHVFVGPIVASGMVIASTDSALWIFLEVNYSDALAVEMGGQDLLVATQGNQQIMALTIRGISDLINSKFSSDAAGIQELAARNASAFAFEILATFILPTLKDTPAQNISRLDNRLPFYQLYEVFVRSGVPKVTFVERGDFELLKLSLAQPGRGVVIEGPSGVGKTTAVEKAIESLLANHRVFRTEPTVQLLSARSLESQRRLQTLEHWHAGIVIIDDFHRLDSKLREKLVDYLKYLADTGPSSKKLVIVGIPETGQTLVEASFDLAMRMDVFKLGLVKDELVLRMIEKGEKALNVRIDRKDEIALAAGGSLNIAQFLCFYICYREGLTQTQNQFQVVHCDIDAAVANVMTDLSRKFGESIRRFAGLGGSRDLTSLLLLNELVNSKDGFLSLPILKDRKPELMHNIERFVKEDWMNKLFREYPASANHFFFDRLVQALVIDDPQLAFYLKKLHFSTLAREVGKSTALTKRKVFISYSHKDFRWLERLRVHLAPIERDGVIDLWVDTKMRAGDWWKEAISEALESASVAITLVSANFLASDFIAEYELPTLLSHATSGGTVILPIIVSPCLFNNTELSAFQAVNPPDKPLSAMTPSEREQVLVNVAEVIRKRLVTDDI